MCCPRTSTWFRALNQSPGRICIWPNRTLGHRESHARAKAERRPEQRLTAAQVEAKVLERMEAGGSAAERAVAAKYAKALKADQVTYGAAGRLARCGPGTARARHMHPNSPSVHAVVALH